MRNKKRWIPHTAAALALCLTLGGTAVPALAAGVPADGVYTQQGEVQKFTYTVDVDVTIQGGKVTGVTYQNADAIAAQNSPYAESAILAINEQLSKGGVTSVSEIDTVSGATLSTNAIRQAVAAVLGEAFDLDKANAGLTNGKEGEEAGSLEDTMKKAKNFLRLEDDADGYGVVDGVDTSEKSEAWLGLFENYKTGLVVLKGSASLTDAEEAALLEALNSGITAVKAESGNTSGGHSGEDSQTGKPDSSQLEALVSQAEALQEADYTPDSWKLLQDELAESQSLLTLPRKQQTALDQQQADLQAAIDALVPISPTEPALNFSDVADDAWYAVSVSWAVQQGVTTGTTNSTFSPETHCSRAQAVTFLWRLAGSPTVQGVNPFRDVSANDWFYQAVLWAAETGVTSGVSADSFAPENEVTRAQFVTFLYNYAGKPAVAGSSADFTDVAADDWYFDSVLWAAQQSVTSGMGDGSFAPEQSVTRAQAVTFLQNYFDR